jgi:hypothetical protein
MISSDAPVRDSTLGRVGDVLSFLAAAGGFVAVLGACVLLARRVRRSGAGGGLMGPLDEVYHPAAHRVRFEIEAQAERMVPLPSPDDQSRPGRR